MKILKKIVIILCVFALTRSLFGCGGKPRYPENYSVGEHEGHWSILYTDEDGVEEIANLGSQRQPLMLQQSRLWFTEGNRLVTVDADGEDRQETVLEGMPAGTHITLVDEENLYCLTERTDRRAWRVSLADQQDWSYTDLPRAFRELDYAALEQTIREMIAAKSDLIYVRGARVELDSNGSVISMELRILSYRSVIAKMRTWETGLLTVQNSLDGPVIHYTNLYLPISLSQDTVDQMPALDAFFTTVAAVDTSQLGPQQAQGEAEGFRLTYQAEAYEAWYKANKKTAAFFTPDGQPLDSDTKTMRYLLGQVGGCETAITDEDGTGLGNLLVIKAK